MKSWSIYTAVRILKEGIEKRQSEAKKACLSSGKQVLHFTMAGWYVLADLRHFSFRITKIKDVTKRSLLGNAEVYRQFTVKLLTF